MANLKASKKGILTDRRNRKRNLHYLSRLRHSVRDALAAIESKDGDSPQILRDALRVVAKTAQKGVIPKNKASRMKSKLQRTFNEKIGADAAKVTAPKKKAAATSTSTEKKAKTTASKAKSSTTAKKTTAKASTAKVKKVAHSAFKRNNHTEA